MPEPEIRKTLTLVEETFAELTRPLPRPIRRAVALAVVSNPFAGRYVEDLSELIETGAILGDRLGRLALATLGCAPEAVEGYGKAALVGEDGEMEHAAALLHPKLGAPLRALIGGGAALIPSAKGRGGPGRSFDVPLGHRHDAWSRAHFDAITVSMPDAPRAGEIVLAVALTDGGRPLPRVGGGPPKQPPAG